jgi:hypothetical protein
VAAVRVRAHGARGDSTDPNRDSTAHAAPHLHANLDGDIYSDAVGRYSNADGHLNGRPHAQCHSYQGTGTDRYPDANGDADSTPDHDAIACPINDPCAPVTYPGTHTPPSANGHCAPLSNPHADDHTLSDSERHAYAGPHTQSIPV